MVSLKYDYAFREVFSHEAVSRQFLSDVLGILPEDIRSVRVANPYLWRRYRRMKLGILDMAMELGDGTKVNIELQVRLQRNWVRRLLFYWAKMYTEDLRAGQDYGRLRRCVSISILDFRLLDGEACHSAYWLCDRAGKRLTDLLEVHIIELPKEPDAQDAVGGWIRLFNAKSEEDLRMVQARNAGMAEAVRILREMGMRRTLRSLYEAHLKAMRDRYAEDEYVREMGRAEGRREGKTEGRAEGKAEDILQFLGDFGDVPENLRKCIMAEKDVDRLGRWLRAAAKAESVQQFMETSGIGAEMDAMNQG